MLRQNEELAAAIVTASSASFIPMFFIVATTAWLSNIIPFFTNVSYVASPFPLATAALLTLVLVLALAWVGPRLLEQTQKTRRKLVKMMYVGADGASHDSKVAAAAGGNQAAASAAPETDDHASSSFQSPGNGGRHGSLPGGSAAACSMQNTSCGLSVPAPRPQLRHHLCTVQPWQGWSYRDGARCSRGGHAQSVITHAHTCSVCQLEATSSARAKKQAPVVPHGQCRAAPSGKSNLRSASVQMRTSMKSAQRLLKL